MEKKEGNREEEKACSGHVEKSERDWREKERKRGGGLNLKWAILIGHSLNGGKKRKQKERKKEKKERKKMDGIRTHVALSDWVWGFQKSINCKRASIDCLKLLKKIRFWPQALNFYFILVPKILKFCP